ncbi:hypothetical protein GCG54_00009815 [Colletotrichum gloeosporioides]|uniref:Ankyrin repeat protein n=1 Tax=Colletotrichum gloeosporioides TaxID=474922 RepID=A0A8H4CYH7_COLGL|nr:uncharacterized protein GCG54_00009815 [Colletotrichum gloeosporioides]KAF3812131.1 hypothetical protein GCG54_00009815 [Colletotrichum gloeosporioides]
MTDEPDRSAEADDAQGQSPDEDYQDAPPTIQREEATSDENAQDPPSTIQREEVTDDENAQDAAPTIPLEEHTGEMRPVTPSAGHEKEVVDDTDATFEETALHRALQDLDFDDDSSPKLDKLDSDWKGMINIQSSEPPHLTPLHMAVERNFPKVAKRLIECGADANIGSSMRPLHTVCNEGYVELARLLLNNRASAYCRDTAGWYPIHFASREDSDTEIFNLLLQWAPGCLNEQEDNESWTPLNVATYFDSYNAVNILMQMGAAIGIRDGVGWTPLMTAVRRNFYHIFDNILNHIGKKDVQTRERLANQADDSKVTVLMALCDVEPGTAFKARASLDKFLDATPELDFGAKDCDGRTALHYIIRSARIYPEELEIRRMAQLVIGKVPKDILLLRNAEGQTALEDSLDDESSNNLSETPLRNFLEAIVERLRENGDDRENLLCWLASREDCQGVAKDILSNLGIPKGRNSGTECSLVELAIHHELPRVLLECKIAKEEKEHGKGLIADRRKELQNEVLTTLKEPSPPQQGRKNEAKKSSATKQSGTQSQHNTKSQTEAERRLRILDQMEDVLDYSYVEKTRRVRDPLKVSKLVDEMQESRTDFQAAIISICRDNSQFSRYTKFRSVAETVYGSSPIKTISDTINEIKKSEPTSHNTKAFSHPQASETESNFTWIHLPATNDTMNKILNPNQSDNLDGNKEDDQIASFLRTSGVQVPDKTSPSRFMQPRYVKKPEKEVRAHVLAVATTETDAMEGNEKHKDRQNSTCDSMASALYMPFLAVGSYKRPPVESAQSSAAGVGQSATKTRATAARILTTAATKLNAAATRLNDAATKMNANGDAITTATKESPGGDNVSTPAANVPGSGTRTMAPPVHYSPTLDKHYYHFAVGDVASQEDRDLRNENQVVTKYLYRKGLDKQVSWKVLRVNQLWAWTIRDELEENVKKGNNAFVEHILENLADRAEKNPDSGPRTPTELSKVIVEWCIGAYRKQRKDTSQQQGIDGKYSDDLERAERPIRQMFSDSINDIGRQEADLFRNLTGQKSSSKHQNNRTIGSKREVPRNTRLPSFETDTMKAARLLFEIKDVRDELNILRTIAEYQQKVQLGLNGIVPGIVFADSVDWDEDETAKYVSSDIEELDRLAKKTEEALNTTITIYESEIGNLQAKEAAEQGKRVMVFTLVTVFFLPLSFLSSLFALDVNSFLEAPWWSLVVIFVVPLPFLHAANGHVKGRDPFSLYLLNKENRDGIEDTNKTFRKRLARGRGNKNAADASANV